jgi:transposase
MSLLELFCAVDDFCQHFEPLWHQHLLAAGSRRRQRRGQLSTSEILTILIHFHQTHYRDFKADYLHYVAVQLRAEFPQLVSYQRFVELIPTIMVPLCAYLIACFGTCTGVSLIDSTALAVCHNRRISQHKVFAGIAERGKTSLGWFYGFKLHVVVNDRGELLGVQLTPGNTDDRKPVPALARRLYGKLFADKGYLSQALFRRLHQAFDLQLITHRKRNMKNQLMPLADKLLLRKRAIIETIFDQLKNISQIEHTRHRSPVNFVVNLLAGLVAYCHQPKKPSLRLDALPRIEAVIPN